MTKHLVYWVCLPGNTDMYTQGYIGITNYFGKRMNAHKQAKSGTHFARAIRLYGWDNLTKVIVRAGLNKEEALMIENDLRPYANIGWNILPGGQANHSGVSRSIETCEKIRIAHTGMKLTEEQRLKRPKIGGIANPNFKGPIVCQPLPEGDSFIITTGQEMRDHGFLFGKVYDCINGKRNSHKGFTFSRLTVKGNKNDNTTV